MSAVAQISSPIIKTDEDDIATAAYQRPPKIFVQTNTQEAVTPCK
jgi:hypothetical protein